MHMIRIKPSSAFTLVEMLVYLGIFSVMIGAISSIFILTVNVSTKETTGIEVSEELQAVIRVLESSVQNASLIEKTYEGINEGDECAQYCTVKIRTEDPTTDPTIIRSASDGVYIKKGAGSEEEITSDHIRVDTFTLTKHDISGGSATLEIGATFTYDASNPEFSITKSLRSAISKVSAVTFDDDLTPTSDDQYNIGQSSPAKRWKNFFLSGILGLGTSAVDVGGGIEGALYYNTTDNTVKYHDGTNWYAVSPWSASSTSSSISFEGDNVGIGTDDPQAKMHIVADAHEKLRFQIGENLTDQRTHITFYNSVGDIIDNRITAYAGGGIAFSATPGSNDQIYFENGGNVGIGTADPEAKLDIEGSIRLTGEIHRDSSYVSLYNFKTVAYQGGVGDQVWLLTENTQGNNEVLGTLYGQRSSGNYQASVVDILVTTASSNANKRGLLHTKQGMQSNEVWSLITCDYGGNNYIALRYVGNSYPFSGELYFDGLIISTLPDDILRSLPTSDVTNIVAFDYSGTKETTTASTFLKGCPDGWSSKDEGFCYSPVQSATYGHTSNSLCAQNYGAHTCSVGEYYAIGAGDTGMWTNGYCAGTEVVVVNVGSGWSCNIWSESRNYRCCLSRH